MMRNSLRTLLFTIISGFLLVIAMSLSLNQLTINAHSTHNRVLSFAYEIRTITEEIIVKIPSSEGNDLNLSEPINKFNQGLKELKEYGKPQDRPIGDFFIYPTILHDNYDPELESISATWAEFITSWDKLSKLSPSDPNYADVKLNTMGILTNLFSQVDSFSNTLDELDDVQDQNQTKVQLIFLGLGLLLLAWGSYVIIFRVLKPLSYLDSAVRGIGHGENTQPIKVIADDELGRLSRSFDTMRMEISAAQKLLEDRVEERTKILSDAFDFSQEIVSQPDFNKLVDSITQRAKKIMRAKSANLCLVTRDMNRFELASKSDEVFIAGIAQSWQDQLASLNMTDAQDSTDQVDEICKQHRLQAPEGCLSAPLQIGDRKIGAICILRDKDMPFTEIEHLTFTLLANSATVAIANIRLMEDSRQQVEVNATLAERQRLTSELHDEVAQTLNLLNLRIGELEDQVSGKDEAISVELEEFIQLTERAQAQMRMAFSGMNSTTVNIVNNLCDDLADYIKEFSSSSGIPVELVIGDLSSLNIPPLIQGQAMYIYREALTNVERYANANKVQVRLERVDGGIQIMVSDNGRGFDINLSKSDHHLGLAIMEARTERVGGTLSVESAPGVGTKVIANIPISASANYLDEVK